MSIKISSIGIIIFYTVILFPFLFSFGTMENISVSHTTPKLDHEISGAWHIAHAPIHHPKLFTMHAWPSALRTTW